MQTQFESDLQAIAWHELDHAYGPADGIPDWIRALRSDRRETRQEAIEHLSNSINHQGSVYSASLAAIPFLQSLVRDRSVHDRQDIILLLLHLAIGYPDNWLPAGFAINTWAKEAFRLFGSSTYADLLVNVYHAVRGDARYWVHLLSEPSVHVRIAAGYALAWFREEALAVLPSLRRSLDRAHDTSEVANSILSLGLLNGYLRSGQDSERFHAYIETGGAPVIGTCAIMALANTTPQAIDDAMLGILFAALDNLEAPPMFYWNDGYLRGYVAKALGSLGGVMPERVVPGLCDAITSMSMGGVTAIADALGGSLFPEGLAEKTGSQGLNLYQRMFLTTLADNWKDGFGREDVDLNFVGILRGHGIPDSPGALAAFLRQAT